MSRILFNNYIELEYIESQGKSYVNLPSFGKTHNLSWKLDCQYMSPLSSASKVVIMGSNSGGTGSWYINNASSTPNYYRSHYELYSSNTDTNTTVSVLDRITIKGRQLYDSSGTIEFSNYSYTSIGMYAPTTLFDLSSNSSTAIRFYRFTVYDGNYLEEGDTLLDLVPVKEITSNNPKVGLLDLLTGNFYYSASSTQLVAGPFKVDVDIKYDVYMGNTKFDIKMNDEMFIPYSDYATREEVEVYFGQMTAPTLSVSGNVATLTFTAIPEYIAKGMLKHKMVQFRVVRNKANQTTHRRFSYGRSYKAKNWVKETFQSGSNDSTFTYDNNKVNHGPYNADVTILNTPIEQANSVITLSELTSGTIQRTCKWNYKFGGGTNNYTRSVVTAAIFKGDGYVYNQFKVGLVYYNKDSVPTLFRVANFDYHS